MITIRILLMILLTGGGMSQLLLDIDPLCYQALSGNGAGRFIRDVYEQSFGIGHNIGALKTLDVRETNIFQRIQKMKYSGGISRKIYSFLSPVFNPYIDYMVDGAQLEYDNETWQYNIPDMNPERTGSLEELLSFIAANLEGELSQQIAANHSWVFKSLEKLHNFEAEINTISNKDFHKYINDNLAYLLDPDSHSWLTYTSDFRADKLSKYLKKKAFFQPEDYHRLNGGDDILSYVMIQPKVMQSPKVKPLLRMTLAKFISDTPDFDEWVFLSMECFLSEYGKSIFFQVFGIEMDDIMKFVQKIDETYEENFITGSKKNSSYWIDWADAILREFEILDIDDLFYQLYAVVLKTRNFLLNLDVEKKIIPEYRKIESLLKMSYLHLLSGQWSSLEQAIESSLTTIHTYQFWKKASISYPDLVNKFWHSLVLDPLVLGIKLDAEGLKSFATMENMFKLEHTEVGNEIFAATRFLRNYRKMNQESIFQPDLNSVDPRTIILKAVKWLRTTGPEVYKHVESEMYCFRIFPSLLLTGLPSEMLRIKWWKVWMQLVWNWRNNLFSDFIVLLLTPFTHIKQIKGCF